VAGEERTIRVASGSRSLHFLCFSTASSGSIRRPRSNERDGGSRVSSESSDHADEPDFGFLDVDFGEVFAGEGVKPRANLSRAFCHRAKCAGLFKKRHRTAFRLLNLS
jgi:hypothetical protein